MTGSNSSKDRGKPRLRVLETVEAAKAEMKKIGSDEAGIRIMAPKAIHLTICVDRLPIPMAQILKEEMLSAGGEVARAKGAVNFSIASTDVVMFATIRQYRRVVRKLRMQPFGLKLLADEIEELIANSAGPRTDHLQCGKYRLNIGERTLIMGILNLTPDSFSGDGMLAGGAGEQDGQDGQGGPEYLTAVVAAARQMVKAGADIIDVGGESTRPGATEVSAADEIGRVIPVIEALAGTLEVPVSIDTYKAEVAAEAIRAGASMVNDISGLKFDSKMADVIALNKVPLVVMHTRGTPQTMQNDPAYDDVVAEIIDELRESLSIADKAGIDPRQLIVDPGIGFGKRLIDNLEILARLKEFRTLGLPILIGTSRKGFIGTTLDVGPGERVEGTAATVALAIAAGADIVRVHDVKEMTRVARMSDAVIRQRSSGAT